MTHSTMEQVTRLVRKHGVMRPKDLDPYGLPRQYLHRLHERGELVRLDRGLYALPDLDLTEHHDLAEASKLVPSGVVCLLSALRFHELTTQAPHQVWMAIEQNAWRPEGTGVPLRIVYMSGESFRVGVEEHPVENVPVRIYSAAKTVADCFKFRNKVGLDVAIEALRDYVKQRTKSRDELWHYAKVCRVTNVMRPYMEALT